jgi:hypothetical protein
MIKLLSVPLILVFISSCVNPAQLTKESNEKFNNLTSDFVKTCTTVKGLDDPLENFLVFSTEYCYQQPRVLTGNDQFLRVFISKEVKSLQKVQVYNVIYTRLDGWINPRSGNFLINGKLNSNKGKSIDTDVDCTNSRNYISGSCLYIDHYGFDLPSEIFEEAKRLKESGKKEFAYKIKTQRGDFDRKFNVEEILGLQEKIKDTISML